MLREWAIFLGCLAIGLGALAGEVRGNGMAALLLLAIASQRRGVGHASSIAAAGLIAVKLLRESGSWYAAHAIVDFVAFTAAVGVALLCAPASLRAWISSLPAIRIAGLFVLVPSFVFAMGTNPSIAVGDTQPVLPTVVQMLRCGNRDLTAWDDGRWNRYCIGDRPYFLIVSPVRDGLYSSYPAGMEVFAFPVTAIAAAMGCDLHDSRNLARLERVTAAAVCSISLALFFLLACHFTSVPTAYLATFFLATGSTFTTTISIALWQQSGIVFWMLVILLCEAGCRSRWMQAAACAMMLACRPSAMTFLVPFGIFVLTRDPRRGLLLIFQSSLCYLPWAWLYLTHYGSPFGPSMNLLAASWQPAAHLWDILSSPARGLLVYQPWLLLLLRGFQHPWQRMLGASIFLQCLLIASWPMWWGGHCYGSRLLAETIPLFGLLLLKPLDRIRQSAGVWILAALGIAGLALHLPGAYGTATAWNFQPTCVDAHPERLTDWSDPPFLYDFLHRK